MVSKSEQHFSNWCIVAGESLSFSVHAMILYISRTCFGHHAAMW
jgi:hypothetical protein